MADCPTMWGAKAQQKEIAQWGAVDGVVGPKLIGSGCGVMWSAEASAIAGKAMIGRDRGSQVEGSSGVTGSGEEMSHFLLLRREVVKVDTCASGARGGRKRFRRGEVLDRARGAVLFFALCKTFLKTLADVVRNRRLLEPCLNVSQGFVGEAEFREEDARRGVGGSVVTVTGKEVREDILFPGEILDLEVALGEDFPPSTEATVM